MSSKCMKKENTQEKSNPLFNSKLYFDLDNKSNDTDTYESDNSLELDESENEISNDYLLLNDLVKQLDPIFEEKEKNQNVMKNNKINQNLFPKNFNTFFSFNVNNNYEFFPKNFFINNTLKRGFINDKSKIGKKNFKERKGDWICLNCNNLNFAFRTQCNICKRLKENSTKKII